MNLLGLPVWKSGPSSAHPHPLAATTPAHRKAGTRQRGAGSRVFLSLVGAAPSRKRRQSLAAKTAPIASL